MELLNLQTAPETLVTTTPHYPTPDVNFGIYFPCPDCRMAFDAWQGFVVHMIVEHWWERELADAYWKIAVRARHAASV